MKRIFIVALMAAGAAGLPAQGATGTSAGDYYNRSLHAKAPEQRLELLNKALAINPNHVPSLQHRARVYLVLGKKELALADSIRAAELLPGDPAINIDAALRAEALKEYGQAAQCYRRALAANPKDDFSRYHLANSLIKLRQPDEALKHADYLVQRRPQQDFPYVLRADVYDWAGRYADAVRDLTVIIQRHPNDRKFAGYYLQRCMSYRLLGDGEKALADAQKAMRLGRTNAFAYAARGCSYEVLGKLEKALGDYAKAAELADDERYYQIWSCIILRKLGRRAEADKRIKAFAKELKSDEWIAPVVKYLAGEITEPEAFRLARHDDPETNREQFCEAYYYVGACYLADEKLDKAEELFKKCLAQRVNNFYEHGFAIRDLRAVEKLRAEKAAVKKEEAKGGEGGPK